MDDDEGSESGSDKSDKDSEDEEEEEEEDGEGGGGLPKFQKKLSSTFHTFDKKLRVSSHSASSSWHTCMATKANKYSIKILSGCSCMMMGFAPKNINLNGSNYNSCGYYFYNYNGTLYSGNGKSGTSFSNDYGNQVNTIYGAVYDKKKVTFFFTKIQNYWEKDMMV